MTIEYPLDQSYTFTMTATLRNNVLQVLGDDDFSVTSAYRALIEDAEGMGLTRMTELYQDAYDAYLAG